MQVRGLPGGVGGDGGDDVGRTAERSADAADRTLQGQAVVAEDESTEVLEKCRLAGVCVSTQRVAAAGAAAVPVRARARRPQHLQTGRNTRTSGRGNLTRGRIAAARRACGLAGDRVSTRRAQQ